MRLLNTSSEILTNHEFFITKFIITGDLKTVTALAAVMAIDDPKYMYVS